MKKILVLILMLLMNGNLLFAQSEEPVREIKVQNLLDKVRELEKDNNRLNDKLASSSGNDLAASAVDVQGVTVVASVMENANADSMRKTVDQLREKIVLQLAQEALGQTDAQVSEIALKLGYSELSAFDRAFGRLTGMSPLVFRRFARTV